jgi:hypothetical protein
MIRTGWRRHPNQDRGAVRLFVVVALCVVGAAIMGCQDTGEAASATTGGSTTAASQAGSVPVGKES